MSDLIIKARVLKAVSPIELGPVRLQNSARCLFRYGSERLSVLLYDIERGELEDLREAECSIAFLTGNAIANSISNGDTFELAIANFVVATGVVEGVVARP